MLLPFSRILALLMAGVLCFALLVPLALQRHNIVLAIFVGLVYILYLIGNVIAWQRMKPRA